eukprot:3308492-Amphidinium_carterae.1
MFFTLGHLDFEDPLCSAGSANAPFVVAVYHALDFACAMRVAYTLECCGGSAGNITSFPGVYPGFRSGTFRSLRKSCSQR